MTKSPCALKRSKHTIPAHHSTDRWVTCSTTLPGTSVTFYAANFGNPQHALKDRIDTRSIE
jgi:hypothetical protein